MIRSFLTATAIDCEPRPCGGVEVFDCRSGRTLAVVPSWVEPVIYAAWRCYRRAVLTLQAVRS